MLIEKPFGPTDVISIKISNGDELISRVFEISDTHITITKPLLMTLIDNNGKPAAQMVPFFMLSADRDGKFAINKNHIICFTKADPAAVKNYNQLTTGLTMPGSGITPSV